MSASASRPLGRSVFSWRGRVWFRPEGGTDDVPERVLIECDGETVTLAGDMARALWFVAREAMKPKGPGIEYEVAAMTCRCGAFDRAKREAEA